MGNNRTSLSTLWHELRFHSLIRLPSSYTNQTRIQHYLLFKKSSGWTPQNRPRFWRPILYHSRGCWKIRNVHRQCGCHCKSKKSHQGKGRSQKPTSQRRDRWCYGRANGTIRFIHHSMIIQHKPVEKSKTTCVTHQRGHSNHHQNPLLSNYWRITTYNIDNRHIMKFLCPRYETHSLDYSLKTDITHE